MSTFISDGQQTIEINLRCDASTAHKVYDTLLRTIEVDYPDVPAKLTAQISVVANEPASAES